MNCNSNFIKMRSLKVSGISHSLFTPTPSNTQSGNGYPPGLQPTQKNRSIMINKKLKKLMPLFAFALVMPSLLSSCKKAQTGYEPVTPLVGFVSKETVLTVPDTATVYSIVELSISEINRSFGYDVYFKFDDNTVVNNIISIDHDGYKDPVTGIQYYKIPIVQGVKKGAFTFIPRENTLGNKTFSVTLVNNPTGTNNYTVDDKNSKATISITN